MASRDGGTLSKILAKQLCAESRQPASGFHPAQQNSGNPRLFPGYRCKRGTFSMTLLQSSILFNRRKGVALETNLYANFKTSQAAKSQIGCRSAVGIGEAQDQNQ